MQGDIADLDLAEHTLREHEIDVVVNFAAESHNSLAVVDPGRFARTNVLGTQLLLEAARAHRRLAVPPRLDVRGLRRPAARLGRNVHRGVAVPPRTPYNASKAAADHYVRRYHETFGLPISITNCSNNYGPFQFPEKVIPLFITNALDDKPLPMYASTQNRREWLHVRDHCRAIDLVLQGPVGETYNVGSGIEKSIEEIADVVVELTGKSPDLKQIVPDRPGHDRRYLLDSSKIGRELGWEPQIGLEEGLRDTVEWYAANRAWWEPLKERRRSLRRPGEETPPERCQTTRSEGSDTGPGWSALASAARRPSRQWGSAGAPDARCAARSRPAVGVRAGTRRS